ncbi:MAG: phosphomannomutase/phosphoglucomutase [Rhodanobacteraceae bacterium]
MSSPNKKVRSRAWWAVAPRGSVNWRAPLLVAVATLLLLLGAFFAWQAHLVLRERTGEAAAERIRKEQVTAIGSLISQKRSRIESALTSGPVQQALAPGGDAARTAAAAALVKSMPEIEQAVFYSAGVNEVLNSDLSRFGYSRAALLMQARISGKPESAEMRMDRKSGESLVFALPVRSGGAIVAYAVTELSFEPILKVFRSANLEDARLDLRQGDGTNDLMIASAGHGNGSSAGDPGVAIAGSSLRIAKAEPSAFIVVSHSFWRLVLLTIACFVGGFGALWLRYTGIRQTMDRLRRKPRSTVDEATLAQTMSESDGAAPPVPIKSTATAEQRRGPDEKAIRVDRSMFRSYDIRGVVGDSLTPPVARLIGRAIGSEARDRGLAEIVVGRDGRLSGPELSAALIEGLRTSGIDVIDIGLAPTPLVYFAGFKLNTGSGVAVTGSHNPPNYNGFKIVLGGETLAEQAIQDLYERIQARRFRDDAGGLQLNDVGADYCARIGDDIQVARRLKVVVDCGNGVAGAFAPRVLEEIGCEVQPLYCEVDGNFPNHHPDPSDPANLKDLILTVTRTGADLGLAFDGDGDRLGVVTRKGEIIFPDRVLMLFAIDVLSRNPGATIIYDVKCTGHLQSVILQHAGSPLMWKTGHSLIKAKMRETGAALAGEMSGHFFFKDRWFGFDDAIYAAARLLEIVAGDVDERSAAQIFASLPNGVSTPELKIPMPEGEHHRFIERFERKATFEGARVTTIDGLRADWPDGWGLVRASNTTPVLVLRFDADSAVALERIKSVFREQLLAVDPDLSLPF